MLCQLYLRYKRDYNHECKFRRKYALLTIALFTFTLIALQKIGLLKYAFFIKAISLLISEYSY